MGEIAKIEGEAKDEFAKFGAYMRTLELKFFKGKLHQKVLAPHPEQVPGHAWLPIDSSDEDPHAGTSTSTDTTTSTSTDEHGAVQPVPAGGTVIDTEHGVDPPVPDQPTPQTQVAQGGTATSTG